MRLRLYLSGQLEGDLRRQLGDVIFHLGPGNVDLDIIDIEAERDRAAADHVFVAPTLLREGTPHRRVVGELNDPEEVVAYFRKPTW